MLGYSSQKEIYVRQQGSSTFHFFLENGQLKAYVTRDGIKNFAVSIKGINSETLGNDPDSLIAKLHNCYFSYSGLDVHVTPLLRGGWGEDIHSGMDYMHQHHKGTYMWVLDLTDEKGAAETIAKSCQGVDDTLETNPIFCQGRHFNTNTVRKQGRWDQTLSKGGESANDSRLQYALQSLKDAVINIEENPLRTSDSLQMIGIGLHSIQDIFAHDDVYVSSVNLSDSLVGRISRWRWLLHHVNRFGENADNPYHIKPDYFSEGPNPVMGEGSKYDQLTSRYFDTQAATYIYLTISLLAITSDTRLKNNYVAKLNELLKKTPITKNKLTGFLAAFASILKGIGFFSEHKWTPIENMPLPPGALDQEQIGILQFPSYQAQSPLCEISFDSIKINLPRATEVVDNINKQNILDELNEEASRIIDEEYESLSSAFEKRKIEIKKTSEFNKVYIVGPDNVGKSSLGNILISETDWPNLDRHEFKVGPQSGTTRANKEIEKDGVVYVDTAGLITKDAEKRQFSTKNIEIDKAAAFVLVFGNDSENDIPKEMFQRMIKSEVPIICVITGNDWRTESDDLVIAKSIREKFIAWSKEKPGLNEYFDVDMIRFFSICSRKDIKAINESYLVKRGVVNRLQLLQLKEHIRASAELWMKRKWVFDNLKKIMDALVSHHSLDNRIKISVDQRMNTDTTYLRRYLQCFLDGGANLLKIVGVDFTKKAIKETKQIVVTALFGEANYLKKIYSADLAEDGSKQNCTDLEKVFTCRIQAYFDRRLKIDAASLDPEYWKSLVRLVRQTCSDTEFLKENEELVYEVNEIHNDVNYCTNFFEATQRNYEKEFNAQGSFVTKNLGGKNLGAAIPLVTDSFALAGVLDATLSSERLVRWLSFTATSPAWKAAIATIGSIALPFGLSTGFIGGVLACAKLSSSFRSTIALCSVTMKREMRKHVLNLLATKKMGFDGRKIPSLKAQENSFSLHFSADHSLATKDSASEAIEEIAIGDNKIASPIKEIDITIDGLNLNRENKPKENIMQELDRTTWAATVEIIIGNDTCSKICEADLRYKLLNLEDVAQFLNLLKAKFLQNKEKRIPASILLVPGSKIHIVIPGPFDSYAAEIYKDKSSIIYVPIKTGTGKWRLFKFSNGNIEIIDYISGYVMLGYLLCFFKDAIEIDQKGPKPNPALSLIKDISAQNQDDYHEETKPSLQLRDSILRFFFEELRVDEHYLPGWLKKDLIPEAPSKTPSSLYASDDHGGENQNEKKVETNASSTNHGSNTSGFFNPTQKNKVEPVKQEIQAPSIMKDPPKQMEPENDVRVTAMRAVM